MSNKTFNMSTDQSEREVPLPHRDLQLGLSPESPYSNSSPSPDSNSSVSNLSDREASSSPDDMLESCNPYNTTLPQGDVLCGITLNLNQTFVTHVNGSENFWDKNLNLMSNHETGSEMYQTFCEPAMDGNTTAVMFPDSPGRESHLGSCETSRRGSTENDCSSLSSGDMVIRSNSFCLEDQSFLVVSSLQVSSMSLAAGHPSSPTESNLLTTTLLDGCEKSTDRVTEENTSHPGLGMTFIHTELPTEENDKATSHSLLALPTESETGLLTFVCETSPADCGKEAQCASAEAQLLHFHGAVTPEQGKAFVSTLSVVQDADKHIHTSTSIQNIGNMIPSLPSFSESPCTGNTDSPGLHPVKQQQIAMTPKQRLVTGLLPSPSKVKMEINKFPKVDYSNVKSKIVTRNVHPGPASPHKPSQVEVNKKHSEAQKGASARLSPAKVRSSTTGVFTAKMVDDACVTAVDGQSNIAPHVASAVQCSNATSETEHAASSQEGDAPAQNAGNQTFCLSPLEKSPDRSDQTETKPTPKKGAANKTLNLNQTFVTHGNGSENFWDKNLNLMSNHETGSEMYQTFCEPAMDGNTTAVMFPDSPGRESHLGSCETSRRGSTENDCSSLSSGDMVIRSNSFCLEDQSFLVVSSLQVSSMSLAAGHPSSPTESNLLTATLLDGCEKSTERVTEENTSHPGLGMTFIHTELPTEENDKATSHSLLALPTESETGLLTFVCETSPADCGKEAQCASAEAQLLHFHGAVTPEQGKAFVSTLSVVQDADKHIYTSTPIQNIGNMIPSLPSFSESPCTGNTDSPGLHPVKQQQIAMTPKQRLVAGLLPSPSKVKMEMNKFPKVDYSNVKSKIVTRNVHPGPASPHKPSQVEVNRKHSEAQKGASARLSPAKVRSTAKMVDDACVTAVDGQSDTAPHVASAVQCSNATSETEHAASSQEGDAPAQHAGNQTFCLSPLEKSPDRSDQTEIKPTPKKGAANKTEVRSCSVSGHDKPSVLKTWLRCSSESSVSSRPTKEKRPALRFSASFSIPKADAHVAQTKQGNQSTTRRAIQATNGPAENSTREVKKISLVVESGKSTTAGASLDENKNRFRARPSPRQTRAPPSQAPSARPRAATLSARQRQATLGRDECRTPKAVETTAQTKQKSSTGNQRAREPSHGTALTASIKPQLNGSRPPQTPIRPSPMGSRSTPASRPLHKTLGPSRGLTEACVNTEQSKGAGRPQVSGGAAHKSTPFKNVVQKARLLTTPAKNTGSAALAAACKPAAPTSIGASNSAASPLKRTGSARFRVTSSGPVNKNKPKASSRQQPPQQQASQQSQSNGPRDVVPASVVEGERDDLSIQQLRGLLAASDCRFEALAIVLQQTLVERDEATRQRRDLSQELVNLREELVCSIHSSECLEKEKDELRVALEDALQKLQEQHQRDLVELEQRLQSFYQAEWDKVHLTYQEEADKCKTLMRQQMEELRSNHEAAKLDLENSHTEQLQCVKQQYEMSLEELSKVHNQELQSLDKTLKDAEATLSGQIEELTAENKALIEKLTAEANRRRELADKSQKDSHILYLEQELESLKVVLDIKNKQLHQQEKKMMEIDKLKEKNVKLDEIFKKVQQENEDLKARMDRHAALSRQLSTEQAVLQESLQKESKVNKRLSMENEELLWKLHNGDLSSPRKVSPTSTTSPSHSFSLQSPRTSGLFSSPPLSPR